jgi:hypothetical protein
LTYREAATMKSDPRADETSRRSAQAKKKSARRVWARCVGCGAVARVRSEEMAVGGAACPVLCQLGAFMVAE